jgi:hypothetical protein
MIALGRRLMLEVCDTAEDPRIQEDQPTLEEGED